MKNIILTCFLLMSLSTWAQNNSIVFNGGGYVDIGNQVANGFRTLEMFIQPNFNITSSTPGDFYIPIQRNTFQSNNSKEFGFVFHLASVANSGKLRFKVNGLSGSVSEVYSDTNQWLAGKWYHIAVVLDRDSGMMMFVDGQKQRDRVRIFTDSMYSDNNITVIGCQGNTFNRCFNGRVDEVRFSSTARYLQNFPTPCRFSNDTSTLGLYNLDNIGVNNVVTDSSSNGFDGTATNLFTNPLTACIAVSDKSDISEIQSDDISFTIRRNVLTVLNPNAQRKEISLISMDGKSVATFTINSTFQRIELSEFQSGIYLLSDFVGFSQKIMLR